MMTSARASSPARCFKPYQCGVCMTSYSRADHLMRHMSAHTKQKPFSCWTCSRAFTRQDLLKRHSLTHRGVHRNSGTSQALDDSGRHGSRVQQACRSCASKKLRCSDSKPCQRCVSKKVFCDYEQTAELPPPSISVDAAEQSSGATSSKIPEYQCVNTFGNSGTDWEQGSSVTVQGDNRTAAAGECRASDHDHTVQSDIWGCTFDLPNLGDYIGLSGHSDVDHLDLSFLQDEFPTLATHRAHDPVPLRSNVVGIGSEAYATSDVRKGWNPGHDNHALQAKRLDLPSIPRSDIVLIPYNLDLKVNVNVGTRDKILAMIYDVTSRTVWERISVNFASLEMLKSIIQHALLEMQDKQAIPFIHLPSFDVNSERPELVGALIAYGAVFARSVSLREFGYGIHEVVRLAVNQKVSR